MIKLLIPGKLYIPVGNYVPTLYKLIEYKDLWGKFSSTNILLRQDIPILFTGKTIQGGVLSKLHNIYTYYEFLYLERIVYILAISYLDRL